MSDTTAHNGLDGLDTPFLAVDLAVMDRNIERLAGRLRGTDIQLRPHAKSHKCVEIAQRQIDSGAIGLTVATIREAEVFAEAGFTDLFIAYPLWVTAQKARRLRQVASRAALRVAVDSAASAQQLAEHLGDLPLTVVVEVDSGHHRTGVAPDEAGPVAAAARSAGLNVVGIFTFPGHGYTPGQRAEVAAQESHALDTAAASLRAQGIDPSVRSGGSTRPSAQPTTPYSPRYARASTLSTTRSSWSWMSARSMTSHCPLSPPWCMLAAGPRSRTRAARSWAPTGPVGPPVLVA
ncbi:alanine racemase, N-terminal domain protein [Mycobacteroides abscessus MAB_091912_2446]|uniref:Alanine racemase, N-terminal domain protein n=1 Tax=Mycobacteroides abscessus MAB_091912_2446 TaxID=1335414 RepID=A0A829MF16_9MYCO|nr:alanine racemase, N-terminal domain protein [Mycobacteroides abscessus MAB_091912_2446]